MPNWQRLRSVGSPDADVADARIGFLTTPAVRGKWKTTPKVSGQPVFLIDEEGRANSYALTVSTNVPSTNRVIFGNWRDLIIASFAGLDVVVDPYTNARKRIVNITAHQLCDVAVRHGESFIISTDSGAQ